MSSIQLVKHAVDRGLVMFNIKEHDSLRSELYTLDKEPYTTDAGEVIPVYDRRYDEDFKVTYTERVLGTTLSETYLSLDIEPASQEEVYLANGQCLVCGLILKGLNHEVNNCCTYSHFRKWKEKQ